MYRAFMNEQPLCGSAEAQFDYVKERLIMDADWDSRLNLNNGRYKALGVEMAYEQDPQKTMELVEQRDKVLGRILFTKDLKLKKESMLAKRAAFAAEFQPEFTKVSYLSS